MLRFLKSLKKNHNHWTFIQRKNKIESATLQYLLKQNERTLGLIYCQSVNEGKNYTVLRFFIVITGLPEEK